LFCYCSHFGRKANYACKMATCFICLAPLPSAGDVFAFTCFHYGFHLPCAIEYCVAGGHQCPECRRPFDGDLEAELRARAEEACIPFEVRAREPDVLCLEAADPPPDAPPDRVAFCRHGMMSYGSWKHEGTGDWISCYTCGFCGFEMSTLHADFAGPRPFCNHHGPKGIMLNFSSMDGTPPERFAVCLSMDMQPHSGSGLPQPRVLECQRIPLARWTSPTHPPASHVDIASSAEERAQDQSSHESMSDSEDPIATLAMIANRGVEFSDDEVIDDCMRTLSRIASQEL
jgi:hypothetical protein